MGLFGKSSGEQKTAFNEEDREIAKRALGVYGYEINGSGFRWEFDVVPNKPASAALLEMRHLGGIEHLQRRVDRFGEFVDDIGSFVGRPIMRTEITEEITEENHAAFGNFHAAVGGYVVALAEHGPDTPQVLAAEIEVAQLVQPKAWREAGYEVSEHTVAITDTGTNWYLTAVAREHPDELGR